MYRIVPPMIRASKKNSIVVELKDMSNAPVTAKVAADITVTYMRWAKAFVQPTAVALANPGVAHTAHGFVQISATRCPGLYRFDVPDTEFVNDGLSDYFVVAILCAGCQPDYIQIPLTDLDDSPSTVPKANR